MSTIDLLFIISKASFVCIFIGLIMAIVFWFRWDIPQVFAELDGKSERKSVRKKKQKKTQVSNTSNHKQKDRTVPLKETSPTELLKNNRQTEDLEEIGEKEYPTEYFDEKNPMEEIEQTENKTEDNLTEKTEQTESCSEICSLEATEYLEQENIQKNKPERIKLEILEVVMLIHTKKTID